MVNNNKLPQYNYIVDQIIEILCKTLGFRTLNKHQWTCIEHKGNNSLIEINVTQKLFYLNKNFKE